MIVYKSYDYLKIILNDYFEAGIEIYNNILVEELEEKRFGMYTAQIQSRTFQGSFEDYKKLQNAGMKNKNMDISDKQKIEKKVKKIKKKKKIKTSLEGLKGG